ncbi:MAG: hypothetical protein ACK5MR_10185 [Cumulibacter sp.]
MVDNAMIGAGETGVVPQLLLDYTEENDVITFTMVYTRITGTIGYGKFHIDMNTEIVSILEKY